MSNARRFASSLIRSEVWWRSWKRADPNDKLEVYRQLGLKLTYDNETRVVVEELLHDHPCA